MSVPHSYLTAEVAAVPHAADQLDRSVPEVFIPTPDGPMFPKSTHQDLLRLRAEGWVRLGVAAAIIDQAGRLLILEHGESERTPAGAMAPMTETIKVRDGQPESTEETLFRAIRDELGVKKPWELGLQTIKSGAWFLSRWPNGQWRTHESVLGVNLVLALPDEGKACLNQFSPTPEIQDIAFVRAQEVLALSSLREGTIEWFSALTTSGLISRVRNLRSTVDLRSVDELDLDSPGWEDSLLDKIKL